MANKNKKHKKKPPVVPNRPKVSGVPFSVSPNIFDIQRIKEQATADAVRILEEKMKRSDEELNRLQVEAYNEALDDAMKYILVMGCRALSNKFKFGYIRLDRFISETMRLIEEADIDETEKWLESKGFKLQNMQAEKE